MTGLLWPAIAGLVFLGVCLLGLSFMKPTRRIDAPAPIRTNGYLANLALDMLEAGVDPALTPQAFLARTWGVAITIGLIMETLTGLVLLSIAVTLLVGNNLIRGRFVTGKAQKQRNLTTRQVAEAADWIASSIAAGNGSRDALQLYADRADPGAVAASLNREKNRVAEALLTAIRTSAVSNHTLPVALRDSAKPLGNRYYASLVETYIQNADKNTDQTAKALRALHDDIMWDVALRSELRTRLSATLQNYKVVGGIIVGLGLFMGLWVPTAGAFFGTLAGQILICFLFAYWYGGYRLQRRPLNRRF
jgi:hypothetical protein